LLEDLKILDSLVKDQPATVSDIRRATQGSHKAGVEPEDFWMIGEDLNYDVDVTWSDTGADGRFDAVFTKRESELVRKSRAFCSRLPRVEKPLDEYANDPLKTKYEAELQNEFAPQAVPELRNHLRERLPDYMLPSAFVIMDGLPVTANGKIDRQALPAPDKKRPELAQEYKMPRNEVEKTLARIWSEVLGVERVGIEDNFFDLGGHSLLATQIMSRVSSTFNADVPLRSLFEEPTVSELAKVIERYQSAHDQHQPSPPPKLSKMVDSLEQQLANLMQLPDEQVNSQLAAEERATSRRGMK
jgi:acyl carrier protein